MLDNLFPRTSAINAENHLVIGGCDAVELAREYGTPLYIFDDLHLRERAREVRQAFQARWANALPLYATKAYFSPYLARIFKEAELGLDVTSEGELRIAKLVDFPHDRIYLHGNNKTATEIQTALTMGVDHIIVDNLDEIELLAKIAGQVAAAPRVLLRLAPTIDAHTHRYMATGVAESKFGLPMSTGDAMTAARRVVKLGPRLQLVGLHVHIGSQVFELEPYRDAIKVILDFASELKDAVGFKPREINLGGGWGVGYREGQESLAVEKVAEEIARAGHMAESSGDPGVRILVEPGRALVAQAAVALYTVGSVKRIEGVRTYVSVDGGIGDNIRPALYGARYSAFVANKMKDPRSLHAAIAGRYCEQGDILVEEADLAPVAPGDLVAIPVAGAYQIPMASNYNLIPRPAVVAARDGKARLVRRRESLEDMLKYELEPEF